MADPRGNKAPDIVAGIATTSGKSSTGGTRLVMVMDAAVVFAIKRALQDGVSVYNTKEINRRVAAARERVKTTWQP